MSRPIDWTDLEPMVPILRAQGLNVEAIAERLGVHVQTFQRWRRANGIVLARISQSKPVIGETRDLMPFANSRDRKAIDKRHAIVYNAPDK